MFAAGKSVAGTSELLLTYNGTAFDGVNGTAYTFSNVSLGAEGGDRTVVVLIDVLSQSTSVASVTSVTVGGQAATALVSSSAGYDGSNVTQTGAAYVCALPTGTTGTVTVNLNIPVRYCLIYVYSLYGSYTALMTRHEKQYDYINGYSSSLALSIGGLWDYGPAIAMAYGYNAYATTNTISGQLTQRAITKPEMSAVVFLADTAKTNALSFTTTASSSSSHMHIGGFLIAFMPTGEPSAFNATISTNQVAPNLATLATGQGWDGAQKLKVTINAGVTVAALSVTQSFPNGLHIVNNGNIYGYNHEPLVGTTGSAGGTALYTRSPVVITNNGNIYGGGGSGGGGGGGDIYGDYDYVVSGRATGGRSQGCQPGTTTVQNNLTGQPGAWVELGWPNTEPWWGWVQGGQGGSGGAWGEVGGKGFDAYGEALALYYYDDSPAGLNGGNSGFYLDGAAYASWRAFGSFKGRVT